MEGMHPAPVATPAEVGVHTELAVRPSPELAVRESASGVVIDTEWRTIRERPYAGPHDRPRSVVVLAAFLALAICGVPCLVFLLAEAVAR